MNSIFNNLFILDLANNHFGDLKHAKKIISHFHKVILRNKIYATIKFQFRDLDTYIHANVSKTDNLLVKRFLDTRLTDKDFQLLFKFIKNKKIRTSCTPFDENSVSKIEKMNFDFIKIASASALDFSIHERVAKNSIPKIISTGGLNINEIDKIVSFYSKKAQKFALMHCVAIYPSKNSELNLRVINDLQQRYRGITIGWSTHEDPNEFLPAPIAYCYGARIFEKHIGINSNHYKLNDYSITPEKFECWYLSLKKAISMSGERIKKIGQIEKNTIYNLQRGVYAKCQILNNEYLTKNNTYFAFPLHPGQLSSSDFKPSMKIKSKKSIDQRINKKDVIFDKDILKQNQLASFVHEAKAMLNYNNITINGSLNMEVSHHYGIDKFRKTGCFLFNIINKKYAKKIIVMLPNQNHPWHFHKKKFESFLILFGELELVVRNRSYNLKNGDIFHVKNFSWHKFRAGKSGCIFEEISTTSFKQDSVYKNKKISLIARDKRKTYIDNWFSFSIKKS